MPVKIYKNRKDFMFGLHKDDTYCLYYSMDSRLYPLLFNAWSMHAIRSASFGSIIL